MTVAILCLLPLTAAGEPELVGLARVAPDHLVVTIDEGSVTLGELVRYEKRDGDQIETSSNGDRTLRRGGEPVGMLVGPADRLHLRTFDTFAGSRINEAAIDDPGRWSLRRDGRPGPMVTAVARKSFITDAAMRPNGWAELTRRHVVTLRLDRPAADGRYIVRTSGSPLAATPQPLGPNTVSPAIHVSAVGFRPDQPGRRGFLSWWTGAVDPQGEQTGGIDYSGLDRFEVIDERGRTVAEFDVGPTVPFDQADDNRGQYGRPNGLVANRAGVDVVPLPLDRLTEPGEYRLRVDGIGTSHPFPIGPGVYDPVWKLLLRGVAYHRRNIPLEMTLIDGSAFTRPAATDRVVRTDRPFDGMEADRFAGYQKQATGEVVPDARGGWMDAGDFDTNHNHARAAALFADLVIRHPDALAADDCGTPDSGNGRPDLLDEAIWHVETYLRLQSDDGAVPSAIEYREHPNRAEPSWLNTLPVYLTAPATESNDQFAIAAARVARALDTLGLPGSDRYRTAAVRAYDWARANPDVGAKYDAEDGLPAWAAAELLLAGHDGTRGAVNAFLASFRENPWKVFSVEKSRAIATLLEAHAQGRVSLSPEDELACKRALASTLRSAYAEGSTEKSSFGVLKHAWAPFGYSQGTTPPLGADLLTHLFDDAPPETKWSRERSLAAAVSGAAYAFGGNPLNRAYVTGLSSLDTVDDDVRCVRNILHLDTRYAGRRSPVGVVVYGTVIPRRGGDQWPLEWLFVNNQKVHPLYEQWPAYENLHEYYAWPVQMEYTIWESNAALIGLTAELAVANSVASSVASSAASSAAN